MNLDRIPGEGPGELVYSGRRAGFTVFVKKEYAGAPWDWVILEGKDAVAFGDAESKEDATDQMLQVLDVHSPPPPEEAPTRGGLVGLVGRLLWGDDARRR